MTAAVLAILLIPVPLLIIWLLVVADIVRQPTMSRGKKAAWLAACTLVWPTQIAYILVRPQRGRAVAGEVADDPHAKLVNAVLDHEAGEMTDADFARLVAQLKAS